MHFIWLQIVAQVSRSRRAPLAWSLVYVAFIALVGILIIDKPLAVWLKANVGAEVEGFFKVLTKLGEVEIFLVPAALAWLGLRYASMRTVAAETAERLRRLSYLPLFLIASVAISGIVNNLAKVAIGRVRPRNFFEEGFYGFIPFNTEWGMNSFPSGHSQAAFAIMTALAIIFPRYDLAFIAMAVLVATSRVVTTVHWFSDAVVGSWLAIAVTVLLHRYMAGRGIDVSLRFQRDQALLR
ncbi:MAG: phosphatase PAP2 family protein [Magnetospirillum gryphiswaldense]|nr:phosphatase PAP2 family protein [Magnetospirillum gryphiswaldense]